MENNRVISFKNFKMIIKPGEKPDSVFVAFEGGLDVDSGGWESSSGDRKKLEDDFKFMFNPYEAPSLKKGEYILHFKIPEREKKFHNWVENQKKMFFGIEDDK
jgi:hypothetical protein